ncbi:UNVERIFIED_CONTAM: hypothetical protein NCL1_50591 [Trichonephila clavipes]
MMPSELAIFVRVSQHMVRSWNGKDFMDRSYVTAVSEEKSIATYLAKKGSETLIEYIPFDEIPVKSPNASPMDFSINGTLNRA